MFQHTVHWEANADAKYGVIIMVINARKKVNTIEVLKQTRFSPKDIFFRIVNGFAGLLHVYLKKGTST